MGSPDFGDVFSSSGINYVFLADLGGILYAARIPDLKTSRELVSYVNQKILSGRFTKDDESKCTNCYTILNTGSLYGRVALIGFAGKDQPNDTPNAPFYKLCDEDLQEIRKTIITSRAVAIGLKEFFQTAQ